MKVLVLFTIAAGIVVANALTGALWQTGKQWMDTCWGTEKSHADGRKPSSATEAMERESCTKRTKQAFASQGFTLAAPSYMNDPQLAVVFESCPYIEATLWSEVVAGAVTRGGLNFKDYVLPSRWFIADILEQLYPNCQNSRYQANIPKHKVYTFRGADYLDFDGKCEPCETADKRFTTKQNRHEAKEIPPKTLTIQEVDKLIKQ